MQSVWRKTAPRGWEDYQAVGKRIPGTRFISFKVPLKQSLCRRVERSEVFGPWELMQILEKDGQELGLIIDLTFTTRYYNPEDLPDSVFYLKIFTADKLIGVHCTHGLNRTGYLVCRYLIDVDGMDPKEAVELFNSSRGHSIERANYLKDLQTGPKRRPLHQRGMNYQTHGHGLLPPSLPPYGMWPSHPNLFPPRPPHFNNYQWRPPQPQNNWRMPYFPEEDRRREENWRSSHHHEDERRRSRYPPRPSPFPRSSPLLPRGVD
ncbi:unnamed protein product [Coregonus sp. 'balchen']|nr:unnamed protein product [Coregonus sp. 'balchen']